MRKWFLVALCLPLLAVPAGAQEAIDVELPQLLRLIPQYFKKVVRVSGDLVGWDEIAALDSDVSREIMVDLRGLSADVRDEINRVCKPDLACTATVIGPVVHIRGDGISELGIEAQRIDFTPAPDPAGERAGA